MAKLSLQDVLLLPVVWVVKQEVFHSFHRDTLAHWTCRGLSLVNMEQVIIEANVACV